MLLKYQKKLTYFVYGATFFILTHALFGAYDIYLDIVNKSSWNHILFEVFFLFFWVFLVILGTLIYFNISKTALGEVKNKIQTIQDHELQIIKGVDQYIRNQFVDWRFTSSESDIAYLLIKGFSILEISILKGVSESTVKEHAGNIYKKANVKGRTQLTSFFLEDLLPQHLPDN